LGGKEEKGRRKNVILLTYSWKKGRNGEKSSLSMPCLPFPGREKKKKRGEGGNAD